MNNSHSGFTLVIYFFLLFSCAPEVTPHLLSDGDALQKINFNTHDIDENGLIGPPDGKVLIAYIFRIPLDKKSRKEVSAIDPSVNFFKKPSADYYQCIGEGGKQRVLIQLASLSYIKRIDRFYGE